MDYSQGKLPATGLGGATLFGVYFDQLWIVGVAVVLILVGAIAVRLSFRRGRSPSDV